MNNLKRLCIYLKNIMPITYRNESHSRLLFKKIKDHFRKEKHQVVKFRGKILIDDLL